MCQQKDERMLTLWINAACSPRVNAPSDHLAPDGSLERQHPPWILGGKSADLI